MGKMTFVMRLAVLAGGLLLAAQPAWADDAVDPKDGIRILLKVLTYDVNFDARGAMLPRLAGDVPVHVPVKALVGRREPPGFDGARRTLLEDLRPKSFQLPTEGRGQCGADGVLLRRSRRTSGVLPRTLGNQDDDLESWHAARTAECAIALWSPTQSFQGRPFARKAPSVDGERQPTRFHRE